MSLGSAFMARDDAPLSVDVDSCAEPFDLRSHGVDSMDGVLCQSEWRPKSLATLSTEYDAKAFGSPTWIAVAAALK